MAVAADFGVQLKLNLRIVREDRPMAFGHTPEGWPSLKMFGAPVTPEQVKLVGVNAKLRGIPPEDLPFIRSLVLRAYGVGDSNSKGNTSLLIDWLMNADERSIDEAIKAAEGDGDVYLVGARQRAGAA
jgi:hypothetical protein